MRILVAEDDRLLGKSIKSGLEQEGFVVDLVADGNAADAALRANRYCAVTLDLGLPGIPGEALLRSLRERNDGTPVIVVTAGEVPISTGLMDIAGRLPLPPCGRTRAPSRSRVSRRLRVSPCKAHLLPGSRTQRRPRRSNRGRRVRG